MPLQLVVPGPQAHWPPLHPCPLEHGLPQLPQFFGSLFVSISHPSADLLSQSANPAVHDAMAQLELLQMGVALAGAHVVPQPPQLLTSFVVLTSQPSVASPLQSAKPVLHMATLHIELAHPALALFTTQTLLQALQLLGSFVVLTQWVPPQSVGALAGQPETQPEGEHTGVEAPHAAECVAVLQPPQLAGCVMSVSQPFAATPSQSAKPALQDAIAQLDPLQVAVACGVLHTFPHAPQLLGSLIVLTSHPVDAFWSQSANPVLQAATTQCDALHAAVACVRLHAVPQMPQLLGSLARSAQVPLQFD
jgi:hypothetical protein